MPICHAAQLFYQLWRRRMCKTAESEALDVEMAQPIVDDPYELEAQLGQLAEEYTDRYIVKYKGGHRRRRENFFARERRSGL